MSNEDDDESMGIGGGIGCFGMCLLAGFIFWMCTGFCGCHNAGGWFRTPVEVRVVNVPALEK